MLKPILLLVMIAFSAASQQQTPQPEDSVLLVVKFSWAKDQPGSPLIRGAQNPKGQITQPILSDGDLGSRRTEIRNMEKKARTAETSGESYRLLLEVKNTGAKVIKNLIWEFRPAAGPDNYEPKQYLCALRVKPNEKRKLDIWTPYAPVKVIKVDTRSDALKDGEVIINKIEYSDGSVWKKRDWYYALPPDSSQKLSDGKCSVFSS